MKTNTIFKLLLGLMLGFQMNAQTWTSLNSSTTNDVWGVSFINDNQGWISCSGGKIFHTTDGGMNWASQNSGQTTPILRHIKMFDQNTGWVVGDNGLILKTTDGGANWMAQTSGVTQTLRHIAFASATNVWISGGNGTVLHTTDGGLTWTAQTTNTTIGLMSINFVDANNGWVVGSSGGTALGIILHTTDGGTTWTTQTYPVGGNLNVCAFANATTGWAAGNGGAIYNTVDGGATWTAQTSNLTGVIRGMDCTNATNAWVADDSGNIIHTSNGGTSWVSQLSGGSQFFRGMGMVNSNHGFAIGNTGTIMVYTSPLMTVNASLIAFNTFQGTPSATQSITVGGTYLSSNIQVTAPTDFEVSLSAGSGFGATVSLTQASGTVAATPVFVRYNPAVAGTHSGNLSITTGNTTQLVAVSGTSTNASVADLSEEKISVYPNPSKGIFEIKGISEKIDGIQIFSEDGRKVYEEKENINSQIDLSTFQNGTYQLKITTKTNQLTKRIIIAK